MPRSPSGAQIRDHPYKQVLQRGMTTKKRHEVEKLSSLVMDVLEESVNNDKIHVVDIGSGEVIRL
jgi:hypothetical protein